MKSSIVSEILEALQNKIFGESSCCDEGYEEDSYELYYPENDEYEDDIDEEEEEVALYKYRNPNTNEIFFFDRTGLHKKDGQQLLYMGQASEYQGRKVKLNKPFRTPNAKKKFAVYVRNKQGKVIIVRFGSQEMSIKRDDPERRKSFRARHKCDQQKDKTTPVFWSCWQWRANSPVQD